MNEFNKGDMVVHHGLLREVLTSLKAKDTLHLSEPTKNEIAAVCASSDIRHASVDEQLQYFCKQG